jgi:hypothetical protein
MPAQQIDVYRDWLKIEETRRPLNYYQLLKLKKFEDDPVRIRSHYRQLNAHVRKFAAGEFAAQSQALLNELAKAMLCLTDAKRKSEYDASLGRIETQPGKRRTVEELFLLRKVLDRDQLDKARSFADAVGVEIHDAVVQQKLAKPEVAMQIYAESLGVPYVDLSETGVDVEMVPFVPAILARQHSCVPVMVDDGQVLMASPHPLKHEVEDELRLRLGMPVRPVLCTVQNVNVAINRFYTKEAAAAELKAGPKPIPTTAPAGGKAEASAKPAKAAKERPAEQSKITLLGVEMRYPVAVALMAFNFSFMAAIFAQMFLMKPAPGFFKSVPIGLAAGAVVGAVAYLATRGK